MPGFTSLFDSADAVAGARWMMPAVLLAIFWTWETCQPFFRNVAGRWPHAARNLGLAAVNTLLVGTAAGLATAVVADESVARGWGLLAWLPAPSWAKFLLAWLSLDAWMYLWHRANHRLPWLWRFHRLHHSDRQMDVTTAARFHLGELAIGALLRLALIPLFGWTLWQIVSYELIVVAVTQFHHANVGLGRGDRWLRTLIVTPDMHKVHHSDWQPETDSNYSTVLSVWDRLARTFRIRPRPETIRFGLREFSDARWQTWGGMWRTPLASMPPGCDREPHDSLPDAAGEGAPDRQSRSGDVAPSTNGDSTTRMRGAAPGDVLAP